MKKLLVMAIILLIANISATCDDGQIDINNAEAEGLDKLYGVGPAIAQNIIDARPYKTVDDLINAKGIGEVKLSQIKSQDLACVESEENQTLDDGEVNSSDEGVEENEEQENLDKKEDSGKAKKKETNIKEESAKITGNTVAEVKTEKPIEIIRLNSKDIKSESVNEGSNTTYWLLGFVVLLGILFLVRNRRQKTEFDE